MGLDVCRQSCVKNGRVREWGAWAIATLDRDIAAGPRHGLSLLFPAGHRPTADAVARLADSASKGVLPFSVSHLPDGEPGWLEILALGLTFDLTGLQPGPAEMFPAIRHRFGLPDAFGGAIEAISLYPGEHLGEGANLLPVVRVMTGLAAQMLDLAQAQAVVWHPAGTAMEPALFRQSIAAWLNGGAFPALGLTALVREADGALRSEGLAFFTGQELRVEPTCGSTPSEAGKIAVRLVHRLVDSEPVVSRQKITGPNGERLVAEPREGGRVVRVWRGS